MIALFFFRKLYKYVKSAEETTAKNEIDSNTNEKADSKWTARY